jgi:hypothetical protein
VRRASRAWGLLKQELKTLENLEQIKIECSEQSKTNFSLFLMPIYDEGAMAN